MGLNETMTNLANEVRELSGTTTSKSLDTMISDVSAANSEIAAQTELISQIITALEGKGAGSGGSGGVEVPLITINYNFLPEDFYIANGMEHSYMGTIGYLTIEDNRIIHKYNNSKSGTITVLKDSWINISVMEDGLIPAPTSPMISNIESEIGMNYLGAYVDGYLGEWLIQVNDNDNITINLS